MKIRPRDQVSKLFQRVSRKRLRDLQIAEKDFAFKGFPSRFFNSFIYHSSYLSLLKLTNIGIVKRQSHFVDVTLHFDLNLERGRTHPRKAISDTNCSKSINHGIKQCLHPKMRYLGHTFCLKL